MHFYKAALNGGIEPPALEHSSMFKLPSQQKPDCLGTHPKSTCQNQWQPANRDTFHQCEPTILEPQLLIHGVKRGCQQEEQEETEPCDSDMQGSSAAKGSCLIKQHLIAKGSAIFFSNTTSKSKLNYLENSKKKIYIYIDWSITRGKKTCFQKWQCLKPACTCRAQW